MKLKYIKPRDARRKKPSLNMNIYNSFRVGKAAIPILGLSDKSKIAFYNDSDNEKNWYIKADAQKGYNLTRLSDGSYRFSSASLRMKIEETVCKIKVNSVTFIIGDAIEYNGEKYYPLRLHEK